MSSKANKIRADELVVLQGLAESRSKAKALIMAGQVFWNTNKIEKAGDLIPSDAELSVKEKLPYVSRGGLKLAEALRCFNVVPKDFICVDVGASTGGFTDCLLQNGAKKIYAIDVGRGQLHWKLQTDDRVISWDKTNFRHFDVSQISEPIDLVVMDVSFISITKILPTIITLFEHSHQLISEQKIKARRLISLIKPQFELNPEQIGKGGIVRDAALHDQVVAEITKALEESGFENLAVIPSPITGADGNREFLITGIKKPASNSI